MEPSRYKKQISEKYMDTSWLNLDILLSVHMNYMIIQYELHNKKYSKEFFMFITFSNAMRKLLVI